MVGRWAGALFASAILLGSANADEPAPEVSALRTYAVAQGQDREGAMILGVFLVSLSVFLYIGYYAYMLWMRENQAAVPDGVIGYIAVMGGVIGYVLLLAGVGVILGRLLGE
jgi:hypothetical protein